MVINFKDKAVKIKIDIPLKTEYFTKNQYLIEKLNKEGFKYLKDLPEDLSKFLSIKGVGEKTLEKFFNQVELLERTISDTGYVVFGDKIEIPATMFNLSIDELKIASIPLIRFFEDAEIKKIGQIPAELTSLNTIHQIGVATMKKIIEKLIEIKELCSQQKIFALSQRNIVIPDSFDMFTYIPGIVALDMNFCTLADLPIDLRPYEEKFGFEIFISNLEKAIRAHKEEIATKEFIIAFNKLLRGEETIGISKRDALIIKYRFKDQMTLQAIGDEVGLTKERVRQVINMVLVEICRKFEGVRFSEKIIRKKLSSGEKKLLKSLQKKKTFINP